MNHPYTQYENTELWISLKKAIVDLEENNDVILQTPIEYVVGYLCQKLHNEDGKSGS